MMGMNGTFDPDGGQGAGQISGKMLGRPPGPNFEAIRDAAESANMASVTAAAPPSSRYRAASESANRRQARRAEAAVFIGSGHLHRAHRHRRRLYWHLRIQPG